MIQVLFSKITNKVLCIVLGATLGFISLYSDDSALVLSLQDAEVVGLTNSVILKSLRDRKEIFKMIETEKWRNYLPRVSIGYFGIKNLNINQEDSRFNDIRLQLNQLLYDGGETAIEIESNRLQEILNSEDWKINKRKTLMEIRKSYLTLLSNQDKEDLFIATLNRTLSQIRDAIAESESGFITDSQRLEVESKIRELELLLIKTESTKLQAEIDLKKNINISNDTRIKLRESIIRDYVLYPPRFDKDVSEMAVELKPEIKKSRIAVENLKKRKELADNFWKPKVSVGGYYGKNTNGPLPVQNEIYGFNLSVSTRLGSTTNETATNYGIQTDGTGIQRIPGFGPQFVGRGDNAFNSNTLNLFDDLSYSRKILEGKIALSDAIRNKKVIDNEIRAEALKAKQRVLENWQILRLNNSKLYVALNNWKESDNKYKSGFIKKTDYLKAELGLVSAVDEFNFAVNGYILSIVEFAYATGTEPEDWNFYKYAKGQGNTLLVELIKGTRRSENGIKNSRPDNENLAPLEELESL